MKGKVAAGWVMLTATIIGCPASIWWTDEPPFVLFLSWLAIGIEAWNMVQIAEKPNDQDGSHDDG